MSHTNTLPPIRAVRVVALILTLLISTALVSCEGTRDTVKSGITVEPAPTYTYSDSSLEYAEELIYSVISAVELERSSGTLTAADIAKLRTTARDYLKITADGSISEERYLSLLRDLYGKRESLAGVLAGKESISALGALYASLSDTASKAYISNSIYELMLYHYEKKQQAALAAYESDGMGYHLVVAERYEKNKTALVESVGKENISGLLDYGLLVASLAEGGAFEAGGTELTDSEVLMLLSYLDPDELTLGTAGWELVLTATADSVLLADEPSFLNKMRFAAAKNGDAAELASVMPELISLLSSVQARLDVECAALLRSGSSEELTVRIINGFSAEDFERLDKIMSPSFENVEYSTLAVGYYGKEYSEYLDTLTTATLDELRASVGTDGVYNTLKGYIAGKCPALSYAIFYEK